MGFIDFAKSVASGTDKKNRLLRVLAAVLTILVINALLAIPFIVNGEISEGTSIGLALRIAGFTVTAVWLGGIIAARIMKFETLLRGFFFYGLAGFLFFALALASKLFGGPEAGSWAQAVFDWFSVAQRPVAHLLQPLIGMTEFYGKAIVFGLLTVASGIAARSMVREKEFNEKMAERKKLEEESKKST